MNVKLFFVMIKFEKLVVSRICEMVMFLNFFFVCGCDGVEMCCCEVEVELVVKYCEVSVICLWVLFGLGLGLDIYIRGIIRELKYVIRNV